MSETLSERLFRLRNEKGLSQEAAAEAAGVSRVALTRYENGQRMPKMNILDSLAKVYGVTVDYLMGREETFGEQSDPIDPQLEEFRTLYAKMNDDQRERAAEYMRFLISQRKGL